MPMHSRPLGSSAVDESSNVSIPQPRMLPASLPQGGTGIEFQYAFRLDDVVRTTLRGLANRAKGSPLSPHQVE